MRTRTILIGALLLASAGLAQAQDQQQQTNGGQTTATPASSFTPQFGQVDFGFRSDSTSGDAARYNRFRDLRQGGYLDNFKFEKETQTTFFRAEANNVGYRDQRYFADFAAIGKLKASFEWNQVPLYLSEDAASLYTDRGNGVLEIDNNIQQALQAGTMDIAQAMAFNRPFEMRSRRDIGTFNLVYTVNRDVDFKFDLTNQKREGSQVYAFGFGTSPGLRPAMEMAVPLDDRTTDVKGMLEFANAKGMFAVGYSGSWFDNSIPLVRFDNPLRAVDAAAGPSVGQAAWWPTNTSFAINANGSYKLTRTTRAGVALSVGRWTQDEAIPTPTVNTALVAPPLERASVDAQANILSMVYTFNSRPVRNVWLNAKYRYYDYDNQTPHFHVENAIIGDWNNGTQIHDTEPSSFKRKNLDLDASFAAHDYLSIGFGYGREDADRTFRIFGKTADNTFRVTVDSTGNEFVTFRTKYEYSTREGSHFEEHLLEEVGEQPETRHFDIANRDRTRLLATVIITPVPYLSVNASAGTGHDEYGDTGFGLRDNKNNNWSAGFDVVPNDVVSFGASYGFEKYKANQYSRTAMPAPNAQFFDPSRDWWIDSEDTVKTFNASLDLIKAFPKTDVRFDYDLSDGKATYVYGAASLATIFPTTPLSQLAPVKNKLNGARVDVQYFVRRNVALGVAYEYEDYQVEDFSLDTNTIDRLDAVNGSNGNFASTIYSGYLFRPYTAHTAWMRISYLW